MAASFQQPEPRKPAGGTKEPAVLSGGKPVPPVVSEENLDPEKRKEINEIFDPGAPSGPVGGQPLDLDAGPQTAFPEGAFPEPFIEPIRTPEPTENEMREFQRCAMGNKDYRKVYVLFGGAEAHFVDRDNAVSDRLYGAVANDNPGITDDPARMEEVANAYRLAATLEKVVVKAVVQKAPDINAAEPGAFASAIEDLKTAWKRPMFLALLEAARDFDEHVSLMIQRARDVNFFKAVGRASR